MSKKAVRTQNRKSLSTKKAPAKPPKMPPLQLDKPVTDRHELSEEEVKALRAADSAVLQAKSALADIQMGIMRAKAVRNDRAAALAQADQDYSNKIKEIALSYGVDPDDPSGEKWTLDLDAMVLTKNPK